MRNMEPEVRLATEQDIPKLLACYEQARRYMIVMENPDQWGFYYPEPEITKADVAAGHCYVVEDKKQDIFLGVFVFCEGPEPTYAEITNGRWLNDAPYHVIHRMASAGQGGGFADFVLNWCTARTENIRIDTHRSNMNMRAALMRNAFRLCGTIHLENGDARIAFQWRKPVPKKPTYNPQDDLYIRPPKPAEEA